MRGHENSFGVKLREIKADMSVTEFAKKLGLSRQTVGFYLNGNRIPDISTLKQICEKCNVSADDLLDISNAGQNDTYELKPCPFCGDKADYMFYSPYDGYKGEASVCRIWCLNCRAQIERGAFGKAMVDWNRRCQ